MTLPLYKAAIERRPDRGDDGHAGLWFDKFCNRWTVRGSNWTMAPETGNDNEPKLEWIKTLTPEKVGAATELRESATRLAAMVDSRGGRWEVLTTASRFVTGLGRSHPVENGFSWHPTLGTPYLPGSSVKGLIRAWAERDADPKPDCRTIERLLGSPVTVGSICLLDAVPVKPVQLEADIMTPHYAGWTADDPPGDWCSPTPIPFLATAAWTPFLFGLIPRRAVSNKDLDDVIGWLNSAIDWSGGGAKTAVGYGRFREDSVETDKLRQWLRDRERAREERMRAEREANERARRLAALSPLERDIEEFLDSRKDKNKRATTAIIQEVRAGRWSGDAKTEVAAWLRNRMHEEQRWKEQSGRKRPEKDREYQDTLEIKRWLAGE